MLRPFCVSLDLLPILHTSIATACSYQWFDPVFETSRAYRLRSMCSRRRDGRWQILRNDVEAILQLFKRVLGRVSSGTNPDACNDSFFNPLLILFSKEAYIYQVIECLDGCSIASWSQWLNKHIRSSTHSCSFILCMWCMSLLRISEIHVYADQLSIVQVTHVLKFVSLRTMVRIIRRRTVIISN